MEKTKILTKAEFTLRMLNDIQARKAQKTQKTLQRTRENRNPIDGTTQNFYKDAYNEHKREQGDL